MQEVIRILERIFSFETLIYIAIGIVTVLAFLRCLVPISASSRKLRRATRIIITENKQNKEAKSWHDLNFLGDRLQATWADFLQNAEMRVAHGDTCDVTQYINDDTVIETSGGIQLGELAPGLLTSLGILGTFLGLVQGLSGLTLSAAKTEDLLAAMEQLIGGMSTAFLTSIAGVTCSLLFQIFYNRSLGGCRKAIDRFCEVFSLYAMPKPVSEETSMLSLQKEQTAYLRQATDDMATKLAGQMEESIMRAMLPVQRSMDNFIMAATRAQVEGMDRITQLFVQRMNVALGNEFEHLRQVLRETGTEQTKTQQEMRAATEAISRMTQDVINMHQMSQGVLEHFESYVRTMNGMQTATESQQKKTGELLTKLSQFTEQQTAMVKALQESQAALSRSEQEYIARTDRYLGASQEQTREMSREISRIADQVRQSADHFTGAANAFAASASRTMAESSQQMNERFSTAVGQMNQTLDRMRETTAAMPQALAQSRDRYMEQVDQFVKALVRLEHSMERLEDVIDGQTGSNNAGRR